MKRTNGLKTRITAMAIALFVLCTMLCTVPVLASETETAEIIMSGSNGEFFYEPQSVTISDDVAETYGYNDNEGFVSALDALVQMHIDLYGDEFTAAPTDYLVVEGGTFVTKVNGIDTSASSFMTNGRTPNGGVFNETFGCFNAYAINEAPLTDGDVFEFFMFIDTTTWADKYSYFDKYTAEVLFGDSLSLSLNGFTAMSGSLKEEDIEAITEPLPDVDIYIGEEVAGTTDSDGNAVITFKKPGKQILYINETDNNCIPAFCIVDVTVDPAVVAENIANGIESPYADWEISDLAAYGAEFEVADEDVYAMIDAAVEAEQYTTIERIVIELTAAGYDVTKLKTSAGEDLNLIDKISKIEIDKIVYATEAIYALIAYDSGNYTVKDGTTRDDLIEKILDLRNDEGIYGYEWGGVEYDDYDSVAMALSALAPYMDRNNVKTAVDAMLEKLSSIQNESGSWGSANTDAMIICGLAALGVDIDEDERFIKNGNSAIDGLLSYTVSSLDGFWFSSVGEINALATEQAFRALAAYLGAEKNGGSFSVYQFADYEEVEKIEVKFEMYGDTVHGEKKHSGSYPIWIKNRTVEVEDGSFVMELVCAVLDEEGYTYKGAEKGYLSEITSPDEVTLKEQSNGAYSGWLYTVNGEEPDVGMSDLKLKDKDKVRVYFTDDWRKSYTPNKKPTSGSTGVTGIGGSSSGLSSITVPSTKPTTEDKEEVKEEIKDKFTDVSKEHWAYEFINKLADLEIIKGYEGGEYLPDNNITRAELCVILSRCAEVDEITASFMFDDVDKDEWYAPYVSWAAESGIVNGVGENRFAPDEQISRQDLCVMIVRCADLLGIELGGNDKAELKDSDDISDYAKEAVEILSGSGIIKGDENSYFNPKSPATRAEIAKIICGIIE